MWKQLNKICNNLVCVCVFIRTRTIQSRLWPAQDLLVLLLLACEITQFSDSLATIFSNIYIYIEWCGHKSQSK